MDHTGSTELEPTTLADFAFVTANFTFAFANVAIDIDFKRRLSELKMMGSKADFPIGAKVVFGKIITDTDEVGHINPLVDDQSFELMKHG